jgi:UDP-N-acetylmuramoylalanine--D-glutamate ligase
MKQKIGIWGLGIVGKSVIRHLSQGSYNLEVTDKRHLTSDDLTFLQEHSTTFIPYAELDSFLERNDTIIPSPGVDLRPYTNYAHKWLSELDIFYQQWKRPLIAVTGTVGKTSIVHLLSTLLQQARLSVVTGGNIGLGMLDLIENRDATALLEISSFQLELSKTFVPDLAVWTNFYPNHLDRHGSIEAYFKAKYTLIARQTEYQKALLPWQLHSSLIAYTELPSRPLCFFSQETLSQEEVSSLRPQDTLYFFEGNSIVKYTHNTTAYIGSIEHMLALSYRVNWLIIAAVMDLLSLSFDATAVASLALPEHRLQYIGTIEGTAFYNDSKATLPQATQAALEQCKGKPIHLFLGGVSKGVDRKPFIAQLSGKVTSVFCFGQEAESLYEACIEFAIPATKSLTLEEAFATCITQSQPGDQVLFSPAGASFDLFANYQERGERFKALVKEYETRQRKRAS